MTGIEGMPSRDGMFWPIYIYLTASIVIAGSAAFKGGWGTALSIAVASMLSLVAGGGLKASLTGKHVSRRD